MALVKCSYCRKEYSSAGYDSCPWCAIQKATQPTLTNSQRYCSWCGELKEGPTHTCKELVVSKINYANFTPLHPDNTEKHPPQTLMAGGKAASTKGPSFHLIPTVALVKLAERFELGEERKGDKAWNATSKNQECLLDKAWLIERCSHIIYHAMKLRDQLAGLEADESPTDNASAIAWGGVFLICATDALSKEEQCNT